MVSFVHSLTEEHRTQDFNKLQYFNCTVLKACENIQGTSSEKVNLHANNQLNAQNIKIHKP